MYHDDNAYTPEVEPDTVGFLSTFHDRDSDDPISEVTCAACVILGRAKFRGRQLTDADMGCFDYCTTCGAEWEEEEGGGYWVFV